MGLSHRWIIKSVLVIGILVSISAGIAVWLQLLIALFGPKNHRFPLMTVEWPEETSKIEGKERLDLSKAEDVLAKKTRELKERAEREAAEASK